MAWILHGIPYKGKMSMAYYFLEAADQIHSRIPLCSKQKAMYVFAGVYRHTFSAEENPGSLYQPTGHLVGEQGVGGKGRKIFASLFYINFFK